MITVMGATGQIGGEITRLLMDAGVTVRALGRSETKLAVLRERGAETRAGDANDAAFLTEAFRGADAVFTMQPSDPTAPDYLADQEQLGQAIVRAIQDSGVPSAVALSSVGADLPDGTGYIGSLYHQEQRLRTLRGTSVTILRPGYFFENFYASLDMIRHEGFIGDSISPDVRMPMIATRDIARVAADALTAPGGTGIAIHELLGPCDLSMTEATGIIGQHMGKPDLPYIRVPDADMAAALESLGFSPEFARLHTETTQALSSGSIQAREPRTTANTTPTRFEDFALDLARAYHA